MTWIAKHPGLTGARHKLAMDVARVEWAYVEAYGRHRQGAEASPSPILLACWAIRARERRLPSIFSSVAGAGWTVG